MRTEPRAGSLGNSNAGGDGNGKAKGNAGIGGAPDSASVGKGNGLAKGHAKGGVASASSEQHRFGPRPQFGRNELRRVPCRGSEFLFSPGAIRNERVRPERLAREAKPAARTSAPRAADAKSARTAASRSADTTHPRRAAAARAVSPAEKRKRTAEKVRVTPEATAETAHLGSRRRPAASGRSLLATGLTSAALSRLARLGIRLTAETTGEVGPRIARLEIPGHMSVATAERLIRGPAWTQAPPVTPTTTSRHIEEKQALDAVRGRRMRTSASDRLVGS